MQKVIFFLITNKPRMNRKVCLVPSYKSYNTIGFQFLSIINHITYHLLPKIPIITFKGIWEYKQIRVIF